MCLQRFHTFSYVAFFMSIFVFSYSVFFVLDEFSKWTTKLKTKIVVKRYNEAKYKKKKKNAKKRRLEMKQNQFRWCLFTFIWCRGQSEKSFSERKWKRPQKKKKKQTNYTRKRKKDIFFFWSRNTFITDFKMVKYTKIESLDSYFIFLFFFHWIAIMLIHEMKK